VFIFPEEIRDISYSCLSVCVHVRICGVGRGGASLAAVSVLMEGEEACRILCVSSLHVRHCLVEVHHWQRAKSPLPPSAPPLRPLSFPGLSSSFVLQYRKHTVPLGSHWKSMRSCCHEGRCSSCVFPADKSTMLLLYYHITLQFLALALLLLALMELVPLLTFMWLWRRMIVYTPRQRFSDHMQMWLDNYWTRKVSFTGSWGGWSLQSLS